MPEVEDGDAVVEVEVEGDGSCVPEIVVGGSVSSPGEGVGKGSSPGERVGIGTPPEAGVGSLVVAESAGVCVGLSDISSSPDVDDGGVVPDAGDG